jgi:hypothetical protein
VDFVRVYDLVASFLEGQAQLAVVGGLGLHAHGVTRATIDLDLVTEAGVQRPLLSLLEAAGYETLHVSAGFSNHLHAEEALGRLDFIYVDGDTARALFAGCTRRLSLGSRQALVPRAEHLAAMKVQAMKNDPTRELRDLADIQALLRVPGVDRALVRQYFERASLLDRFHAIERSL